MHLKSYPPQEWNFSFFLRIVTFSKCIESSGRVVGEVGVLAEKISNDF